MKTILFPTDFTDSTTQALNWATLFARQYKATLILLHVTQIPMADAALPTVGDLGMSTFSTGIAVDLEPIDRNRLDQLSAQLQAEGITCQTELRWGSVTDAIITTADETQADLVVVGRSHLGNFFERLIGTEATDVARKAHCPVLVVPMGEAKSAQLTTILFSTALQMDRPDEFGQVVDMAHTFGATLSVLNVQAVNQTSATDTEPVINQLKEVYGNTSLTVETVDAPTVTDGIDTYLKLHQPDLLVMTNRERDFLSGLFNPSLTDRMVSLTETPILIYHAHSDL